MTKLVADFKYGTLSAGIGSTDTTITSAEFADLPVVSSPDTMDLVLNPGEVGGDAEIVTVTAHTSASTSVTVAARTGSAHGSGTQWVHAVTAADFNRMGFDGTLEGNASTATALETARTIGGVSFDGTANINLPGVNIAGNQDTSGNAATATKWSAATTLSLAGDASGSVVFDGSDTAETLTVTVTNDSHTHDGRYYTESESDAKYLLNTTDTLSGNLTVTGIIDVDEVRGDNGTNADPTFTFTDDQDTGMYRYGANAIGWACGGNLRLMLDNNGSYGRLFGPGFRTGSAIIRGEATAATPVYTFYADENTGMYRVSADQVGFATGGALRGRFWSQGLLMGSASTGNAQLGTGTGSPGAPVYHFYNDTNTGMYREETDMLGFSAGGEVVGLFRESTNNNTGSVGDGYVAFSTYMGGSTGTSAVIATTTISGQAVKRLMFNASGDEAKDTPVPWEMSDESYKKIAVSSFHYKDMYVDDDGMHHHWDKTLALKGEQEDEPPETWVPLKRHGFMWSQIMEHEDLWPLATDLGISDPAVAAATVSVVQRLIDRVAALEAR